MKVLFIAYQAASDPLMESQGFSYMKKVAGKQAVQYSLLTFETKKSLIASEEHIAALEQPIKWKYLMYRNKPRFLATCLNIILGIFAVFSIVRKDKIDIVHARGLIPALIAFIPVKLLSIKFFFDTRGLLAEKYVGGDLLSKDGLLYKLMRWGENMLLEKCDFFTVETNRHAGIIKKSSDHLSDKMEVIPCCVDMEKFNYLSYSLYNSQSNFSLVYLGKAGTWYLFDEMLDFFKVVKRYMPQLSFIVYTDNDHAHIRSVAIEKKISEQYFSVIKPDNDKIPALLTEASAGIFFINPYKRYNSSPVKFGEYLASGLPVIVNEGIGDCDDVIIRERVGVVVNEFSEDCYKSACEQLMELLSEGDILKKRCRETAERYFSLEMGASKYRDIYKRLLNAQQLDK